MGSEWKQFCLEECMAAIIDYRGKSPDKTSFGVPLVTAKIIKGGRIETPQEYIAEKDFESWMRRGMPKPGDIVLTTEAPLGEVAQLDGRKVALAQQVITLRGKASLLDNTFLKFLLQSQEIQEQLRARSTGTTVLGIRQSELRKLTLRLPPLPEQKAIASILGALDDKIESNRRMNATLEAMARALFQSWFVDFDPVCAKQEGRPPSGLDASTAALFPEQFQDSELGPIPKGWRVGIISDLCQFSRDSLNPLRFPDETFDHYSLPAFDEGRLPKTEAGSEIKSNKLVVQSNAVLLSKLNPHIPRIWAPSPSMRRRGICSTEFLVVVPTSGTTREYLYSLLTSETFSRVYGTLVSGTTGSHQRIKADSVSTIKAVLPPRSLIDAFTNKTKPMLAGINQNIEQSHTLAALRDTLLPKLLGGELRIAHF